MLQLHASSGQEVAEGAWEVKVLLFMTACLSGCREFEETYDTLQGEIDSLEQEKSELKERLRVLSKKTLLEGLTRQSSGHGGQHRHQVFCQEQFFFFFLTYCHLAVIFFQVLPVQAKQSAFSSDTNTACRGFGAVVSLFSAVSVAQKQLKRMLFILTKHNMQSFGVIPFFKLQNYT